MAIDEIRKLSRSLVPPSLGEAGLLNSISDLVDSLNRVNDIEFITQWDHINECLLNDKLKLTIYRIIQEQINNILKHARASTVLIELSQTDDSLVIIIKDDGIGFDTKQKRNGVGLQNIVTRTELFNGNATILSEPGKGCELAIIFYIEADDSIMTNVRA